MYIYLYNLAVSSCGSDSPKTLSRPVLDAALAVLGHPPLHADVPVLAPVRAPAVLHLPHKAASIGVFLGEIDGFPW